MIINDELKNLKVGDEVYFNYSNYTVGHILKVQRITDAHIMCRSLNGLNEYKFRKLNGYQVGSTGFFQPHIVPLTDELREKVNRGKLIFTISNHKFNDMSTEELEAIAKIIRGHKNG